MNDVLMLRGETTFMEGAEGPSSFFMRAYTGDRMRVKGFTHPVVVDFAGLFIPSQAIPIRLDHKPEQGVGHTTRIAIEDGVLIAEGIISRETIYAADVRESGKRGFPWQASIGGPILEGEFVPPGMTVHVNGKTVEGPIHVIRKMTLKEISFVDQGADENTSATVHAQTEERTNYMEETLTIPTNEMTDTPVETPKEETTFETQNPPTATTPTAPPAEPTEVTASAPMEYEPPKMTPVAPEPELRAMFNSESMIQEYRALMAAERGRVAKIEELGGGKFPDMEATAIARGWTPEQFELAFLRRNRPNAPSVQTSKPVMTGSVLEAIALGATGAPVSWLESHYDAPVLDAAEKYRGIGLQEFCELACQTSLPRFRRDAHGWLEAAFSTASLPGILSNIANKMLLEGYNYIDDSWRKICKIASVTDFKSHARFRMTGSFKFEKVGPDGELKHGRIEETSFTQKADTHGIMFALTRQMIIDDDLGALTEIPRQIGMGAGEAITDAVWELLLSNPTQSDGKGFFHASHGNLMAGEKTNLSVNSLTDAEVKFGEQTKPNGRPLGVTPSILLVPTAQKVVAEMLMKSTLLNESPTDPKPSSNPHVGKFDVVATSYLSNATFPGASSKAWYLLADPNRIPAIEVAFLGGMDRPTVERADADFDNLGVLFRGYIDFGVREQDHRGILKVKGEA